MRATILAVCLAAGAASGLFANPGYAESAPPSADQAAAIEIEALQDRWPDRWLGRHHYLYDDDYQPGSETVGSARSDDPRACAKEPIRMRRSDGSSGIDRPKRCE